MKTAFVIIHYNDYPSTSNLLENIKSYKFLDLVVVVDNGSTDSSYEKLKKYENKKIKILREKENKGFAAGLNRGSCYAIEKLKDCFLILSNADLLIGSEENLIELTDAFKQKDLGVVAPVVVQQNTISRGWRLPTIQTEILGNLPILGKKIYQKRISYQEKHYQTPFSIVEAVSGCFFLVRSKFLEEIGFFDENTFLYYEEYILGMKAKKTKFKIAVCNEVTVIHNHSVSVDRSLNRIHKFKRLKESQTYFCKEYLQGKRWELFFLHLNKNLTLGLLYLRNFFGIQ